MALQVWLPLNKDTNVIPDITEFNKEGSVTLTADSDGWYKVADSSHTSSRWGIYKDFTVKPNTQYTLCVYSKSTTGVTAQVAVASYDSTTTWPPNRDTNATSTEKLTTYKWTTASTHTKARVYLNIACSSTVANNYVFFKDPIILEDFSNQGLANIRFTTSTARINTSGKIGSCYNFNASTDYGIYLNTNTMSAANFMNAYINNHSWTLCAWVKTSTETLTAVFGLTYGLRLWIGPTIQLYMSNSDRSFSCTVNTPLTVGKWYHIVTSYDMDTNIVSIYIDGELKYTTSYHEGYTYYSSWTNGIYIGRDPNNSYAGNFYKGDLNDVRIYDHCLSAKEVKEISKGLVLHYPLNENRQPLDNCFSYPTFNTTNSAGGWNHWASSGSTGSYSQNTNKDYIYHKTNTYSHKISCTSGNYYICYQSPAFEGGYRSVQAIIKLENSAVPDTSKVTLGWNANVNPRPPVQFIDLGDGFYLMKCEGFQQNGSDDLVCITVYNGTTIYISEAYLENNKQFCSNILFSNNNIITDVSGYGHDGTISGTLGSDNNSPRYNYGTNYPDSACSIGIGNFSTMVPEGIFTFNIWFKKITDEWSTKNYETIFGGPSGFELEAKNASTNSPSLVLWNWGKGSITYPLDTWNMVTFVRTPSGTKLYLNGVQGATGTAGSIPSGNYFIGSWNSSSSQNYRGYFSDARIYATELSDEDILELYNTSAIIDDHGNSYCYLFTDNYELGEFTKLGIGKFDLIENEQLQSSIYKEVKPNLLSGTYPGIPKKTMTTSTTEFGTFFNPTELLLTNVNYTISMRIRGTAPMCIYTINTGGNYSFGFLTRDLITTDYQLLKLTFKVTGDRTINQIYICTKWGDTLSGEWFEVEPYSIKLEEGNTCTPWIPAETDDMYRSYGKTLYSNELIEI